MYNCFNLLEAISLVDMFWALNAVKPSKSRCNCPGVELEMINSMLFLLDDSMYVSVFAILFHSSAYVGS